MASGGNNFLKFPISQPTTFCAIFLLQLKLRQTNIIYM